MERYDASRRGVGLLESLVGNEDWRKGLILTYDEFEEFEIEGGKVEVMPVWYWLTAGLQ